MLREKERSSSTPVLELSSPEGANGQDRLRLAERKGDWGSFYLGEHGFATIPKSRFFLPVTAMRMISYDILATKQVLYQKPLFR